jgi:hypothetical protein
MTRIPSTDPSTWNAMFQVGDKVKIRVDFVEVNKKDKIYTISSFDTVVGSYDSGKGFQRPENPSGRLYYLSDSGGSWEGKDLEMAEASLSVNPIDQSSFPTPSVVTSPMPSRSTSSKSKDKGILVELGLSKSQIKQLPKSIVDEAEFIDGIRKIVDEMTDDVRKSIMQQSIVEAIDIFKNSLLEQEEVELTEEQKKEIEDFESEEEKQRSSDETEDDEKTSEDDEVDGGDEEPKDGEDQEPKDDEDEESKDGGDKEPKDDEDEEPKRGRDDDDEDKGGDSGGKTKDQGGEDIPTTSSGGGGGGGGRPPSIPDDAYLIPELNDYQKIAIILYILEKLKPNNKATKWDKKESLFFGLSVEELLATWNYFIKEDETRGGFFNLSYPNLFSIIKFLWEWNKGYPAKVLDRYYIYTQYVPFLSFMAAGSHYHTNRFENTIGLFDYKVVEGNKIPLDAVKKPIPNYSGELELAGYFGGSFDPEDYYYFIREYELPIPYTNVDDARLYNLSNKSLTAFSKTNYYVNNYYGAKTQIAQKLNTGFYVERYENFKFPELPQSGDGYKEFTVDSDGIVKSLFIPRYAMPNDFQRNFDKENQWYIKIDNERYSKVYNILKRIQYANYWFSDKAYSISVNVSDIQRVIEIDNVAPTFEQFLRFGMSIDEDFLYFSIDSNTNNFYINRDGGEFDIKDKPKIFQAFSFIPSFFIDVFDRYAFPFPELSNRLEWSKSSSIAFTTNPASKTPPTKKAPKPVSEEKQLVKNEIAALKQALKYLSGEEAESVKNEIEALKQSLKYI